MNQLDSIQNFTATEPTFLTTLPLNNGQQQQPRAFQGPLLGLLIAASLLAKASQFRLPYFPDYDDNPWTPLRPPPNYLPLLYPAREGYVQKHLTTASPQIQPPPLNQQQIIHIHDSPPKKEEAEGEVYQDVNERNHQVIINTIKQEAEEDDATTTRFVFENDSSASNDVININFPQNNSEEFGEDMSATNTFYERQRFGGSNKRHRNNKPASTTRRETHKRPGYQSYDDDYQETRNRNRKRPTKKRPTTPGYDDYDNPNRKKRRPPPKNKFSGNRRPINNPPNYYDSNEYGGDDYYDDYNYQNDFNIFARQGTTTTTEEETETSTTTETTKTTANSATTTTPGTTEATRRTSTSTHHPSNTTGGYTYGPPQTGYGPSNGNENISITYGPPTGPKHETLGPLFDAWYNHYNKNSVFRRLQELLTPNNFYNHHYDVNYHDNF